MSNNEKISVLFIEDSPDDLEMYRRFLKKTNIDIDEATTMKEGLTLIESNNKSYECILTDYNLPDGTAIDLIKKLQNSKSKFQIPAIIFLTGQGNEHIAAEALRCDIQDYLIKENTTKETLEKAIRTAIEKKNFQRILDSQNKALEVTNNELRQFAYILSHDLKSPLKKISSFVDLISDKLQDTTDQEVQLYLERVVANTTRMTDLINALLKYSRIVNATLKAEPINLQNLVDSVVEDLSLEIKEKKAQIDYKNLPEIHGYDAGLRQFFQNLISNALKYNNNAHPHVLISHEQNENELAINIADNGIGIPESHRDKIFQWFSQIPEHQKKQEAGLGIGLAICKKVADMHEAKLEIHSNQPTGTIFTLRLPHNEKKAA